MIKLIYSDQGIPINDFYAKKFIPTGCFFSMYVIEYVRYMLLCICV